MVHRRRGQAALEFLLTYSWAILVVIVIIGALAYFGVLNPKNFIPEKCTFGAGFSCTDWAYTNANRGTITLRITNSLPNAIHITNFTITSESFNASSTCTWDGSPANLADGQYGDFNFTDCGVQAGVGKFHAAADLKYTIAGGLPTPKSNKGDLFINSNT